MELMKLIAPIVSDFGVVQNANLVNDENVYFSLFDHLCFPLDLK